MDVTIHPGSGPHVLSTFRRREAISGKMRESGQRSFAHRLSGRSNPSAYNQHTLYFQDRIESAESDHQLNRCSQRSYDPEGKSASKTTCRCRSTS